ncbi:MAG: RluA family pseudouridine synthase [Bacilli bacterium]|nr:RluA family pseudouridine synthase [Bacilli bacterium]
MNKNDKKKQSPNKGLVDPKAIKEFAVYKETTLMEFLMFKMPDAPRKTIKSLLSHHQVAVGGVPVSQFNYPLVPEDVVTVSKHRIAKHERKDLPIIYEDEDIIAINKPSGLLSVATEREKGKTAYRLISDYVASFNPKARIYVVHRLDEDTSGVLVFAKKFEVREALQNHWQEVVETRAYYAIVEGKMEKDEAVLQDYLMQNDLHLVFVTKNKAAGKLSTTAYKVIAYKEPYSLLDVHISSGRKNQIRVQLGSRGHYVAGDDKYGEPSNPLGRLGLHAYQLTFTNPLSGKRYDFVTPMPESFKPLFFKTHAQVRAEQEEKVLRRKPSASGKHPAQKPEGQPPKPGRKPHYPRRGGKR